MQILFVILYVVKSTTQIKLNWISALEWGSKTNPSVTNQLSSQIYWKVSVLINHSCCAPVHSFRTWLIFSLLLCFLGLLMTFSVAAVQERSSQNKDRKWCESVMSKGLIQAAKQEKGETHQRIVPRQFSENSSVLRPVEWFEPCVHLHWLATS